MIFDVAVVGGGILGSSITHRLCQQKMGLTVAWIASEDLLRYSASSASGAMLSTVSEIHCRQETDNHKLLLRTRIEGARAFGEVLSSLELSDCQIARTNGTFVVANRFAKTDHATLKAIRKVAERENIRTEWVDPADVCGLLPGDLNDSVNCLYVPEEGSIDSAVLLRGFSLAIERHKSVTRFNNKIAALSLSNELVCLHTGSDAIRAKQVVVACGANANQLIAAIDTPQPLCSMSIYGGRGVSVILEPKIDLPNVIRTPNRSFSCGLHMVPRSGGYVYLGATNRFSANAYHEASPAAGELADLLTQGAQQLNYQIRLAGVHSYSVGFRPLTRDCLPVVGRTAHPQILVASGTYRNGVVMSPVISQMIVDELVDPGRHSSNEMSPTRNALPLSQEQVYDWLFASVPALVESLIEINHTSPAMFEAGLTSFVHSAIASIKAGTAAPDLQSKVEHFIRSAPVEEAIPSVVELFARSTRNRTPDKLMYQALEAP